LSFALVEVMEMEKLAPLEVAADEGRLRLLEAVGAEQQHLILAHFGTYHLVLGQAVMEFVVVPVMPRALLPQH
jgi:hypothetical protein